MIRPRWYVPAGLLALLGAVLVGCAILGDGGSPRGFVAGAYARMPDEDLDGGVAVAYTSRKHATAIADEIAGRWRPADRYADGSGIYLRYRDDVIAVLPTAAGSLILVEGIRTAYPRYGGTVGGYWGWSTRAGENARGGGPGAGK